MWTLAHKYNRLTPERATEQVLKALKAYDPFVYKHSKDRSSYYIHFRKLPNGLSHKLRVSDHDERPRYGYKWQLRLDGVARVGTMKQGCRYYQAVDTMVNGFIRYYDRVVSLNEEMLAGSKESVKI